MRYVIGGGVIAVVIIACFAVSGDDRAHLIGSAIELVISIIVELIA